MAGIKWSADKELSHSVTIFSYTVNLVTQSVVAWLVLSLVNCCSQSPSCKARGAASSGRSPTGERGEEKTRPSVRPSPFFDTSVQHACYSSINVLLEMPFTVVFTVSSSVQSISKAVRATRPHIALIAHGGRNTPFSSFAAKWLRSTIAASEPCSWNFRVAATLLSRYVDDVANDQYSVSFTTSRGKKRLFRGPPLAASPPIFAVLCSLCSLHPTLAAAASPILLHQSPSITAAVCCRRRRRQPAFNNADVYLS